MLHFYTVELEIAIEEHETRERMTQCGKDKEQERADTVVHRADRGQPDRTAEADDHRDAGEVLEAEQTKQLITALLRTWREQH